MPLTDYDTLDYCCQDYEPQERRCWWPVILGWACLLAGVGGMAWLWAWIEGWIR